METITTKNCNIDSTCENRNEIATAEEESRLPEIESLSKYKDNPPAIPNELIVGVLRRGHKMLLAGSSKAGKTFLLMQLCIAIAEGLKWLCFECRKGRVLYINMEIDKPSAIDRFFVNGK